MSWAPVTLRWPAQATQWVNALGPAKAMAGTELTGTTKRLASLGGLATTKPGPVGPAAKAAVEAGRVAMTEQMGQALTCLVITPFQSGVGQGRGYQRFLSAPNLLALLGDKLLDGSLERQAGIDRYALAIIFRATHYKQLAETLSRFNALLPVPELVRSEKRARYLSRLEAEKWLLPSAPSLPPWGTLPLEHCTISKAAKQSLSGQLAGLESYTTGSSPLAELSALAARKATQAAARDQQLKNLQDQLANPNQDAAMVARLVGPGHYAKIRNDLLTGNAPGHEWVLCAGLILLGSKEGLSFVQELVGL